MSTDVRLLVGWLVRNIIFGPPVFTSSFLPGDPVDLANNVPNSHVKFSKLRVGTIGSTYPGGKELLEQHLCTLVALKENMEQTIVHWSNQSTGDG